MKRRRRQTPRPLVVESEGNESFSCGVSLRTDAPRFRSPSTTRRSCEEIGWDAQTGRRSEVEDGRPWLRRYHAAAQPWQSVGAEWNRSQLRSRNDPQKPISFCSTHPRSGQIPSYTGTIGSEDMQDIDNMDRDFQPLTLKRSVMPPYTPTAHRATIPGYAGRAARLHPQSASHHAGSSRTFNDSFARVAPLSRLVTPTTPCNPFLRPTPPLPRANAPRHVRQSR